MSEDRAAIWFASILLLLGAAAGQQSSATPPNDAPRQSSSSESQDASCESQPPTATTPFDTCKYLPIGPGIRPPKAVETVDPKYPEAARKAKLNGSVVVAMAVNEKGDVDEVKVVHSSSPKFEQNAMGAAKQWKFVPAMKQGKPVAVQLNTEMTFKIY